MKTSVAIWKIMQEINVPTAVSTVQFQSNSPWHQHSKLINNTFCLQHPSPTSMLPNRWLLTKIIWKMHFINTPFLIKFTWTSHKKISPFKSIRINNLFLYLEQCLNWISDLTFRHSCEYNICYSRTCFCDWLPATLCCQFFSCLQFNIIHKLV